MRTPSEAALLRVWERGAGAAPGARAEALLGAADIRPPGGVGTLTPGQRDAHLLELRRRLFGEMLDGVARCPACEGSLEFSLSVTTLAEGGADVGAGDIEADGFRLRVHPPTIAQVEGLRPDDGVERLLRDCVSHAERDGMPVRVAELPVSILDVVDARLAVLDPVGDIELSLRCPDCAHAWAEPLDVGAFLWSELDAWARRVLQDVHVLARAYGWTEREILRLGAGRRRYYLDLVLA